MPRAFWPKSEAIAWKADARTAFAEVDRPEPKTPTHQLPLVDWP